MNKNPELEKFLLLSEHLTANQKLPVKIAEEYLNRLQLQFPADMQKVFSEIDKITASGPGPYLEFELKRKLTENPDFAVIIQQMLRLWYTSQFAPADDKTDIRTREQYNEGLLWKIVHTEAPGADKKKKYGYWGKKPSLKK
ncbi:MAG: sugar dehydrogenase complex small subunit [Bacteroidota bacterium]